MEYKKLVYQTSLSQALKNSIMQNYFGAQESENPTPMPPFMAEAVSEVCKNLSKIAINDSTNIDYWNSIKEYSEFMMQAIPNHLEAQEKQKTQSSDEVVAPVTPNNNPHTGEVS
jgi:Zn ribbon nucleic-acid-binding protein